MANEAEINGTRFGVGDLVKVHLKIQEGDKTRTQPFEGLVISIHGREENKMFTVRHIASGGIGVERIFPLNSPWIAKIDVKKKGQVRRAKLYYLRDKIGKGAIKVKAKKTRRDDHVRRGKHRVKRDEKEKPGKPRRKSSRKVSS